MNENHFLFIITIKIRYFEILLIAIFISEVWSVKYNLLDMKVVIKLIKKLVFNLLKPIDSIV